MERKRREGKQRFFKKRGGHQAVSRDRGKLGQGIGALKWGAGTPLRTMTFFLRLEMPDQQWHTVVAL